ncbi:hypothetical protein N9H73_02985 [Flavobacteriaceae bacterium]|nr:hypothetical protein [Flavobacteriaceae bacterium]
MTTSLLLLSTAFAVAFGALGAHLSVKKGRSHRFGFFIGFLFGVFGILSFLIISNKSKEIDK